MKRAGRLLAHAILMVLITVSVTSAQIPTSEITKVVMLGTGTPGPDPARSGPSIAIVVRNTPYIVDFGPGVIRSSAALSPRFGGSIEGLWTHNIKRAFLTHFHSDHTAGYPDLILTPWPVGRDEPLEVYGPDGIVEMTAHILKAYQKDIHYRLYGQESTNDRGWRVNAHAIDEGVVYTDENVKVEAFRVRHGSWPNAFGYRFTTPDRTIVISGDSAPSETILEYSRGADILIHEVYPLKAGQGKDETWWSYIRANHTSSHELAELAAKAKPKLLILYHVLFWGTSPENLIDEFSGKYEGEIVLASDLDVF